jgi:predicted adenylyl cyclase CyaB
MLEVELKSVVDDVASRRAQIEAAGGRLVYTGHLLDARYDFPDHSMSIVDRVLRLRVYEDDKGRLAHLDWKGVTRYENGFKVREEVSTQVADPDALAEMLGKLGFVVTVEIEREIAQYELEGATIRFEEYPDMDPLVEVEGAPEAIERAVQAIGLSRDGFTSERLPAFIARFEARTGRRASLSQAELRGERRYSPHDA